VVYGDFIDQDARWPTIRANGLKWVETQRAAGGHVDVIQLPDIGIHGNGHMMVMERNNLQIAAVKPPLRPARSLPDKARTAPLYLSQLPAGARAAPIGARQSPLPR
jgi:hypothetical protein